MNRLSIYDAAILESIKTQFKSATEISNELSIGRSRVCIRLNKLMKFGMVSTMQSNNRPNTLGVKPLLYKKRRD